MANEYYGSTVVNGVLQYSSVSQIRKADKRTKGGCLRRWAYDKVHKIKEADSERVAKAKTDGIGLDVELKAYLRSGNSDALSSLAMKGLHTLPAPGKDLGLDIKMHRVSWMLNGQPLSGTFTYDNQPPKGAICTITSALTAAGVPIVGELDVCHNRGLNVGDENDPDGHDPEGTVEVLDIKRKGTAKDRYGNSTMMEPSELVHDIQMGGYGEWVGRVFPPTKFIRLSHAYFPASKGEPRKVTKLHVLNECRSTWQYAESVVRQMQEAARETNINNVPFSLSACDAYAGCGYRQFCSAYQNLRQDVLYGKIAEDHIAERSRTSEAQTAISEQAAQRLCTIRDGLGQTLFAPQTFQDLDCDVPGHVAFPEREVCDLQNSVREPEAASGGSRHEVRGSLPRDPKGSWNTLPGLQPSSGVRERQPSHALQRWPLPERDKTVGLLQQNNLIPQQQPQVDARAQLEAETAQMRQQHQMTQQMPTLLQAWERIEKHGRGIPALGGTAAQAFAAAKQYGPLAPGAGYAGAGSLAGIMLHTPEHVFQLLSELDGQAPQQAPTPPQQIIYTQPVVNAVATITPQPLPVGMSPSGGPGLNQTPAQPVFMASPNAPESQPQLAMQQQAPAQTQALPQFTQPVTDPTPTTQLQTEAPKKKRGRPANAAPAQAPAAGGANIAASNLPPPVQVMGGGPIEPPAAMAQPTPGMTLEEASGGMYTEQVVPECMVFVDCIPNRPFKTLVAYVDKLNHDLAKRYSVNEKGEPGVQDVRAVPKSSVLAFAAWKGALAECILQSPPAPGVYYVDTRCSDIMQVVADALLTLCERTGSLYVKG